MSLYTTIIETHIRKAGCLLRVNLFLSFFLLALISYGQVRDIRIDSLVNKHHLGEIGSTVIGISSLSGQQVLHYGDSIDDNNSFFNLASVTKTFTGLAILKLIYIGAIRPEDKISKYINGLKPALANVTIEQLVFHTNGIHDYFTLFDDVSDVDNHDVLGALQKIDSTVFAPGTNWGYTNSGYVLLAIIIEKVCNESYASWMDREILGMMNMNNTVVSSNTDRKALYGHSATGQIDSINNRTYGDGSLLSTPQNMMNFGISLQYNAEIEVLIQLAKDRSTPWIRDSTWDIGYGFWFSKDEYGEFIAGSGRSYGSLAYFRYYLDKKTYFYYLTTQDAKNIKKFRNELIEIITNDP